MIGGHDKPRIVYVHGDGVIDWRWGWVTRLHAELVSAGFPTFFELFPDSIEARAKYWLPFLRDHVGACENDVLLGWSCGAVAAMRFAQENPVRGLVLIAPYHTDLGLEVVRRSGFVTEPWSWSSISANAKDIAIFHSDCDPYIHQREFSELAQWLDAKEIQIKGAGHFSDQETFPELTRYLMSEFGNAA